MKKYSGRWRRSCTASKSNLNQNPNQVPDQNPPPNQNPPPPLNPFMPNAPIAPEAPQRPHLHWSHFKPKYTGRTDKDAEVLLDVDFSYCWLNLK